MWCPTDAAGCRADADGGVGDRGAAAARLLAHQPVGTSCNVTSTTLPRVSRRLTYGIFPLCLPAWTALSCIVNTLRVEARAKQQLRTDRLRAVRGVAHGHAHARPVGQFATLQRLDVGPLLCLPARCRVPSKPRLRRRGGFSDLFGANQTIRVWQRTIENGPCTRDKAQTFTARV